MTKRRKKQPEYQLIDDEGEAVYVSTYEITYEPIQDRKYKRLPKKVKAAIERLHFDSQKKPFQAIPELKRLVKKFPHIPILYNYLAVAYSRIGEKEKAEEISRMNIQKNPEYLFARLNYAEFFLMRKEYEKVAEIFDHKFDLRMLYPKRRRFHISEVVNFMGFIGVYWNEIGEREAAEKYNEILQAIEPSYLIAKRLNRKLYPNLFTRIWRRITRKFVSEEGHSI